MGRYVRDIAQPSRIFFSRRDDGPILQLDGADCTMLLFNEDPRFTVKGPVEYRFVKIPASQRRFRGPPREGFRAYERPVRGTLSSTAECVPRSRSAPKKVARMPRLPG